MQALVLLCLALSASVASGYKQASVVFNGYAYVLVPISKNWTDAEDYCQGFGPTGHLASIHNWDEYYAVYQVREKGDAANELVWIGAHMGLADSCNCTDCDCLFEQYHWSDGTPNTNFSYWAARQPEENPAYCVELYQHDNGKKRRDKWHTRACEASRFFVCKAWVGAVSWKGYDQCHYGLQWEHLTWWEARDNCQQWGGNLVSIHSDEEVDFLIHRFFPFFNTNPFGHEFENNTETGHGAAHEGSYAFWIGGAVDWKMKQKPVSKKFSWSDYSPVDYTNWYELLQRPLDPNIRQHIHIQSQTGYWHVAAPTELYPSVCKKCLYDLSHPPDDEVE
jgi:hypothetical protein